MREGKPTSRSSGDGGGGRRRGRGAPVFGLQQAHWLLLCPKSRVKWTAGVPTLLGWLPVGIITPKAGGRQEDKRQAGLTPAPKLPPCLGIPPSLLLRDQEPRL